MVSRGTQVNMRVVSLAESFVSKIFPEAFPYKGLEYI